jgi:hypothetical protein
MFLLFRSGIPRGRLKIFYRFASVRLSIGGQTGLQPSGSRCGESVRAWTVKNGFHLLNAADRKKPLGFVYGLRR